MMRESRKREGGEKGREREEMEIERERQPERDGCFASIVSLRLSDCRSLCLFLAVPQLSERGAYSAHQLKNSQ